jgi:hypothetical protein
LFEATVADLLANHPGGVHKGDPITAHDAARRVAPRVGTQKAAVLAALVASEDGLTGHQLCDATSCLYPHVATTRVEELVRLGLAEPTVRTRATPSGCQAIVWVASERGRWVCDEMARSEP